MHKVNIPLTLNPPSITNYSQFKSFLSLRISKKAPRSTKYTDEFFPQNFLSKKTYHLTTKRTVLNIEKILKTNLQQKLIKKQDDLEKVTKSMFTKTYNAKIKKLICEYKQRVHLKEKVRLDDVESLEIDFVNVNRELFTDNILQDCYEYLEGRYGSLEYLQVKYGEFVDRCVAGGDKMKQFIELRYGRDVFKMDVYENKCIYAELYLSIRIGNYKGAEMLVNEYSFYLEGRNKGISTLLGEFILGLSEGREPENILSNQSKKHAVFLLHMTNASTDRFLIILLKLMSQSFVTENDPVIDTLEDFMFFTLLTVGQKKRKAEIYKMFKDFASESGKLFAYLIVDMNEEAVETMFDGNFSVYECYFLMQNLIRKEISNFKYFVHLVFLIAKHFKETEKKVKIIDSLQNYNYPQKNQLIADNIIKFRLFEIIHEKGIDKAVLAILGEELKDRNETEIILENYNLFEDENLLLDVYCNTIKDIIINNKPCNADYLEPLFKKYDSLSIRIGRRANMLKEFFQFYKNKNEETFRKTIVCGDYSLEIDKDLVIVVERMLILACNVFRKEKNRFCLEKIMCFAGHYQFGNEMFSAINNELLDML